MNQAETSPDLGFIRPIVKPLIWEEFSAQTLRIKKLGFWFLIPSFFILSRFSLPNSSQSPRRKISKPEKKSVNDICQKSRRVSQRLVLCANYGNSSILKTIEIAVSEQRRRYLSQSGVNLIFENEKRKMSFMCTWGLHLTFGQITIYEKSSKKYISTENCLRSSCNQGDDKVRKNTSDKNAKT